MVIPVLAWVVCIVAILFLILLVGSVYRVIHAQDYPSTVFKLNPNKLQTGDILTVGYRHAFGWFVTFWSGSIWSHTGIVWRDSTTNELFVLEAANYGRSHEAIYNGVFKIPFDIWLRINRRHNIAWNKLIVQPTVSLDADLLHEEFTKIKGVKLDAYNWRWYRLLLRRAWIHEPPGAKTCYELTIKMLQHAGIVQKKFTGSSYFPRDIVWNRLDMVEGFNYDRPNLIDPREYYAQLKNTV